MVTGVQTCAFFFSSRRRHTRLSRDWSSDVCSSDLVAKVLDFKAVGRNNLFSFLRDAGILMADNVPYQEYIDRGYFRVIEQKYHIPDGETHISLKTVVYQTGIDFIRRKLLDARYEPARRGWKSGALVLRPAAGS